MRERENREHTVGCTQRIDTRKKETQTNEDEESKVKGVFIHRASSFFPVIDNDGEGVLH